MSDLSRTVLAGTEEVSRAYSGLANLNAVNRERKRKAAAGLGDSLAELGQTIKDYGSWRDAKKAEDETRQVDDAYALGMQTGEPEKALVTLGAVRPTTAAAATLRAKRMEAATEAARQRNADRLNEAEKFNRQQQYERESKYHDELIQIERAKVENEKARQARLGAETPNIDPNSPAGIAAAEEKARRVAEAEATVKEKHPPTPKEPSELDKPYPTATRELFEAKAGLKPGALKDVTRRDVQDLLDLDPQRNLIAALNLAAKQREAQEHEPPELKRKKDELADLIAIGRDIRRTAMYPGGKVKLAADTAAAQAAVDAGAPAPKAALVMPDNMPPEVQASWPKWTDAQRRQFLDELNK